MKKKEKVSWLEDCITFLLKKNPEAAENVFRSLYPEKHLHKNPPKGRKKEKGLKNND